jgi:hypothetical protein
MQNDTRAGGIPDLIAGEELTGMEDRFVKIGNSSGTAVAMLPEANDDEVLFILTGGDVAAANVAADPLEPGRNMRVKLKGTCNPGDRLVLADVATAADRGKARALPSTPGTYVMQGVAEEAGVDGQAVKFRPRNRVITVGS